MTNRSLPIFCYQEDMREISDLMNRTAVLISGGRGMGKTVLLTEIHKQLSHQVPDASKLLIVSGRHGETGRSQLREARRPRVALIDDLDVLLKAPADDAVPGSRQVAYKLLSWILQKDEETSERCRVLASSSMEFEAPSAQRLVDTLGVKNQKEIMDLIDAYSLLGQNLQPHALDPWSRDWEEWWSGRFDSVFGNLLRSQFLLEAWRHTIMELTGGHPALFGPMVDQLHRLCTRSSGAPPHPFVEKLLVDPAKGRDSEADRSKLRENIARYVEDFVIRYAVRPIMRTIRKLKNSPFRTEVESFKVLTQIALQETSSVKPPADPAIRKILVHEGVLYQDKQTGDYRIPGTIVRHLVLQFSDAVEPLVVVRPDPNGSETDGQVVVRSSSGTNTAPLSGAPWRVLWCLYQNSNRVLSVAALKDMANLRDEKAVLNAIQRLYKALKGHKLAWIVHNERGRGYRVVTSSNNSGVLGPPRFAWDESAGEDVS